jgi:hypothetical protein
MNVVAGACVVGSFLLIAMAGVIWRIWSSTKIRGVDPDWLRNFSVSSYRPMERLLNEDDMAFLKAQSGYEPGMERKLRSERRRIFRLFLRTLGRDFNRLHYALRLVALHSPADNPDLARVLIKQKFVFFAAFVAVRIRLELHRFGLGSVDVRGLVATLDTMRTELHGMVTQPMASSPAVS